MRPTYPKLKFNTLRAYFGKPYTIDLEDRAGSVTIYSPTMGDAYINADENNFMATLNIFTTNTTALRVFLDDLGMDWNEVTDFQLFILLYKQADPEIVKLLFGDLDLQGFELYQKRGKDDEDTHVVLYNKEQNVEIDEDVYQHIHQYLQDLFSIKPKEDIIEDNLLKQWWIAKDRRQAKIAEKKKKEDVSTIQPLISACVNHPGFKYKLYEVENMTVAEFWDSVARLQVYESSTALMRGMYSGMISSKDINPESYNFMRTINNSESNNKTK